MYIVKSLDTATINIFPVLLKPYAFISKSSNTMLHFSGVIQHDEYSGINIICSLGQSGEIFSKVFPSIEKCLNPPPPSPAIETVSLRIS